MRSNKPLTTLYLCLFCVVVLLFFAGCNTQSVQNRRKNTLKIALRSDPIRLNPVLATDANSMFVNSFMFNALVKYDENLEITPDLAESWTIFEEGRKVVFNLKQGVKWHDGRELTAHDVVFTMEKVLDPYTNTYNAGLFKVDGKDIVFTSLDDYTIEASLPQSFAPFLNNLTLIPVVPKHILEKEDINTGDFSRNPVGTGPFIFKEWKTSDRVVVTANSNYFKGMPLLESIEFRIIPSPEGARIALLSEQIDAAGLSSEDLFVMSYMKEIPSHIQIEKWKDFTYFYLGFDLTNPIFADINVRKAINYAVDQEKITKAVLHNSGAPLYGPLPIPSWAYTYETEKYPYNLDKAKDLLENSGWKMTSGGIREKDGKKLSFKVIYRTGSRASEGACIHLQSYLKAAGIEINLQALDFGALIRSLYPEQFEGVVFNWAEPFDPDIFTEWHSSQMGDEGMNFMSYHNPEVDYLLEQARTIVDKEIRKQLYKEIQIKISQDAPYVFLWNQESAMGYHRRIKGLSKPSPAGLFVNPEKIYTDS